MTTFYLTPTAIKSLATLHAVTPASKVDREQNPILTAIRLSVTPQEWRAIATDRYIAAEVGGPLGETAHTLPDDGVTVQLASTDMQALAKLATPANVGGSHVGVNVTDTHAEFSRADGSLIAAYAQVAGNFPPVERLFPTNPSGDIAQFNIMPDQLARLAKVQPLGMVEASAKERREVALSITPNGANGNRPRPALVTLQAPHGAYWGHFRGLLQLANIVEEAN